MLFRLLLVEFVAIGFCWYLALVFWSCLGIAWICLRPLWVLLRWTARSVRSVP
jgi:hypothetical protein